MKMFAQWKSEWPSVLLALAALLIFVLPQTALAQQDDPKARAIMRKVIDRDEGKSMISSMEMVLIDKRKNKRVRKLKNYRLEKGKDTLSLAFFLSPADVKGTGFLTYDYDAEGKDDDQWLFLPALRKTKRIASSDKSGSFMGSDFNYSDMTSPDLSDFVYKLVKEVDVDGKKTWQIETTPRDEKIAEESGYSKSVSWIRQDNHVMIRGIRWVYKSRRVKYFQIKALEQIKGIWVASQMQMVTREGKDTIHATLLTQSDIEINPKISEGFFTVRQLEKGL